MQDVIALPVVGGFSPYLDWLAQATHSVEAGRGAGVAHAKEMLVARYAALIHEICKFRGWV